jgi:hypothetical protein
MAWLSAEAGFWLARHAAHPIVLAADSISRAICRAGSKPLPGWAESRDERGEFARNKVRVSAP